MAAGEAPFLYAMAAIAHIAKKSGGRNPPSAVITFADSEDAERFKQQVMLSLIPMMINPLDAPQRFANEGRGEAHGIKFLVRCLDQSSRMR